MLTYLLKNVIHRTIRMLILTVALDVVRQVLPSQLKNVMGRIFQMLTLIVALTAARRIFPNQLRIVKHRTIQMSILAVALVVVHLKSLTRIMIRICLISDLSIANAERVASHPQLQSL